jgi:hypothetical protein
VFEQGGSFGKAPVVDLSSSSDEECLIPDTSRDEEFPRRLFGNLNRNVIGPLGDGNVIIIWITATAGVPVGGLLASPTLTSV